MTRNTSKSKNDRQQGKTVIRSFFEWLNGASHSDFWIFNLAFGGFSLGLLVFWFAYMRSNPSETSDKLLILFSALCSVGAVYLGFARRGLRSHNFPLAFSLVSTVIGIVVKEHQDMSREHVMGFGLAVLVCSIPVLIVLRKYSIVVPAWLKVFLAMLCCYLVFIASISFYQDRDSLIESQHSEYVLNELIAPRAGKVPYQDFVPQYTFLLAFITKAFPRNVGYLELIDFLVAFLTLTACLSLILAITLGTSFFEKKSNGLTWSILVIVPLTSVTAGWGRTSFVGPPTTLLSGPSIRIFVGMALASLLFFSYRMEKQRNLTLTSWKIAWLGLFSGFASAINLDFGIAAALAMFFTCLIANSRTFKEAFRTVATFTFSFLAFWSLLLVVLNSLDIEPKRQLFGWFIRQFGGGFGSVPISYPGPVMYAFPVIFSCVTYFSMVLFKRTRVFQVDDILEWRLGRSVIVLTFLSLWTLFSTPYYLNRSYHSGQMSTLYLPLSVCILGLLALSVARSSNKSILNQATFIPLLSVSIAVGAIWISPNPQIEIKRIQNLNPDGTVPRPEIRKLIIESSVLKQELSKRYSSFAYFGEEGNIVELATGLNSANIYNNPLDMFQSEKAVQLSCDFISNLNVDALLISSNGVAAFAWDDGSLCWGKFKRATKIGSFEVAERINS